MSTLRSWLGKGWARPDLIAVAVVALIGAALCAVDLGTRSLWLDEGSSFAIASQSGSALWRGIKGDGGNMLVYYLMLHVLIAWFGHAAWLLRLPSVIATALTGGLVVLLAQRLFPANRRIPPAAGLLSVVSLPLVYWGQNARGYAWLVTLSVGSFLALVVILQTPRNRSVSRWALGGYVVCTVLAMYVGYDVALLIPAQLVLLALRRRRWRLVIGCLIAVAVLCVPLLILAKQRGSGQLFWVTPLNWSLAHQAAVTLISAQLPPNFHTTATTVAAVVVLGLVTLAALSFGVRAAPRQWGVLVALSWLLVSAVLTLAAYAAGVPIELARVTILVMPALALLSAWLLCHPALPRFASLFALAVVLVLRLAQVLPAYDKSPEDWKAATRYVLDQTAGASSQAVFRSASSATVTPAVRTPACVVFYPQDGRETFDYYLQGIAGGDSLLAAQLTPVLPSLPWNRVRVYVEQYGTLDAGQRARVARQCPRLWLIASHTGQDQDAAQSRRDVGRFYALEHGLGRLYGHTSLKSFGWAASIHVRLFWN